MSEENQSDNDPERTLVTLEQLSQTIEVMTSVVNRLRQHLSDQLQAKLAEQNSAREAALAEQKESRVLACMEGPCNPDETDSEAVRNVEEALASLDELAADNAMQVEADAEKAEQLAKEILKSKQEQQTSEDSNRESFVVEIRQQEPEPVRKSDKTLH